MDHNQNLPEDPLPTGPPKSAMKPPAAKEQPAKKVALKDPFPMPALDVCENPEAANNTRSVETIFIGGETLAEMKEELESNFQDISLTASVNRADQV